MQKGAPLWGAFFNAFKIQSWLDRGGHRRNVMCMQLFSGITKIRPFF
jgi:hypothetical protein